MLLLKFIKINTNTKSYCYPLIKLFLFILVIIIAVRRDAVFHITNMFLSNMVTVISLILTIFSILGIYVAVAELIYVYSNRKSKNHDLSECVIFTTDNILQLIFDNDIIEIEISLNTNIVCIGASSDNRPSDMAFFDKQYFIDDKSYKDFDVFSKKLRSLSKDGNLLVIRIDGRKPDNE